MSWCGGGEISVTPICVRRIIATSAVTFAAGSMPPSPGFAPCPILIEISSACARYRASTPKRPDATCRIRERDSSQICPRSRRGSSPPSPQFDIAPKWLNAAAIALCATRCSAPCDIAAPRNTFAMISSGDATLSIGAGRSASRSARRSRRYTGGVSAMSFKKRPHDSGSWPRAVVWSSFHTSLR